MNEKCAQLWQRLALAIKPQVSADTFKRWFSAVELIEANDTSLTFQVPNNIYQFWIESNHMAALQAAIVSAFGAPRQVKFRSTVDGAMNSDDEILARIPGASPVSENSRDAKQSSTALGLNPRNSFES